MPASAISSAAWMPATPAPMISVAGIDGQWPGNGDQGEGHAVHGASEHGLGPLEPLAAGVGAVLAEGGEADLASVDAGRGRRPRKGRLEMAGGVAREDDTVQMLPPQLCGQGLRIQLGLQAEYAHPLHLRQVAGVVRDRLEGQPAPLQSLPHKNPDPHGSLPSAHPTRVIALHSDKV